MNGIRKIKRRAMARLAGPVMTFKFSGVTLELLNGMTAIQRENLIRAACKSYVKAHRKGGIGE